MVDKEHQSYFFHIFCNFVTSYFLQLQNTTRPPITASGMAAGTKNTWSIRVYVTFSGVRYASIYGYNAKQADDHDKSGALWTISSLLKFFRTTENRRSNLWYASGRYTAAVES